MAPLTPHVPTFPPLIFSKHISDTPARVSFDTPSTTSELDRVWFALPPHYQESFIQHRFGKLVEVHWSKVDFVINWIPAPLGRLTNLVQLHANNCNLKIGNLRLESNELFGPIPAELGSLESLRTLCLSSNLLSGSIPNKLTGEVPSSFGNLASLVEMDLSKNHLSGNLPPSLGKLRNLKALQLGSLSQLEDLYLGGILNKLTGTVPIEFTNLIRLAELFLKGNLLDPIIPPGIEKDTKLFRMLVEEGFDDGEVGK
ncbi:L domain-like protein, partial [Rhizoclosmatium globosum]